MSILIMAYLLHASVADNVGALELGLTTSHILALTAVTYLEQLWQVVIATTSKMYSYSLKEYLEDEAHLFVLP